MKNIITILAFLSFIGGAFAQQELQNTQFMHYKLGYNPGYAGSNAAACISALYRNQWMGLDGAPKTQILSFNMPLFNQKVGVGANIVRESIGFFDYGNVDAVYAYRIRMGQGHLGIGVQASMRILQASFGRARATQSAIDDPSIPNVREDKFTFNFGTGLYYSSDKFYVGLSIPRLLKNNIDLADNDPIVSREVHHFYLMGGLILDLGENVKLQPQALVKYVVDAPIDADANFNFIFMDKYILGMTYRLGGNRESSIGESVAFLAAAQITNNIRFGLSYDFTVSDIKDYSSGSLEGFLHYCFGKSEGEEYDNPRFF